MSESQESQVVKVTMSDGREVAFGKKTSVFNVTEDDNGLTIQGAFIDGNYSSHTIGSVEELHAFAAYGLKAYAKASKLASAAAFDSLNWANPNALVPRKSKGRKATPLESALVEVTGKSLDTIRAFVDSKSRKEKAALAKDPRVAPILARLRAGEVNPDADLLGGLTDDASA